MQVTRPFKEKVRVRTEFGLACAVTTQTVPLTIKRESLWGKVRVVSPFIVRPRERCLVVLGVEGLMEVLSTEIISDRKQTVMSLSGEGLRSGFERENSGRKKKLT